MKGVLIMGSNDNVVGEQLRLLRKLKGNKSQKEFAEFLEIPQPTLSSYESGRIKPTVDAIGNIADKCSVSLDWICGRSGKPCNYTVSQLGQLIYNLSGTYSFGSCSIDIKNGNDGDVSEAVISIDDCPTPSSKDFLRMLKKLKEFFDMRRNFNRDQAEIIRNSIINEFSDSILD